MTDAIVGGMHSGRHVPKLSMNRSATVRLDHALEAANGAAGFSRIMAKCLAMLGLHVPVGYQDAAGFHYGRERAGKRVSMASAPGGEWLGLMYY